MPSSKGKIVFPTHFEQHVQNAIILLDTNIIIHLALQQEPYVKLFDRMNSVECSYFTIDLCYYELLKGSERVEELQRKQQFIEQMAIRILPAESFTRGFGEIISLYRKSSATMSIADLFLASVMKEYSSQRNLLLCTEDVSDFWGSYFKREIILNVEEEQHIRPLVFCRFNEETFVKASKSFYS